MKYTVHAYLRQPGGKVARDLGVIDIELEGSLMHGAVAMFRRLDKAILGRIEHVERFSEAGKVPAVHFVQILGE
jgi:hypothetical protein